MNGWISFWTGLLIAGVTLYGALALAVAVGGLFDIRTMLRRLDEQHRESAQEQEKDAGQRPSA